MAPPTAAAASSFNRRQPRSREEMAEKVGKAMKFIGTSMAMALAGSDDLKFLLEEATNELRDVHGFLISHKKEKPTEDPFTESFNTTSPQLADGYNWVKYGTKKIKQFNDYKRDYYKCSKYNCPETTKGCTARKYVQQISPKEYQVTSIYKHNCGSGGMFRKQQRSQNRSPRSEHGSINNNTVQSPNNSNGSSSVRSAITPRHESAVGGMADDIGDHIWPDCQILDDDGWIDIYFNLMQKCPE